ncbi:MAG: hypothetical protein QW046_05330 [Candidatus Micrarchaeaceae archaeon]
MSVREKKLEALPDNGTLPLNEEVYNALAKVFGLDLEKGSRQVHKVTFYNDYAIVDKLDINDIKRLLNKENEKESEIILRKGTLLFQFEVDQFDMTELVNNLKDTWFSFEYKSEKLIRARKNSYGIYDLVIENPTSARPVVKMLVSHAEKFSFEDTVYCLLMGQKYYWLADKLIEEMAYIDDFENWENIDLNKYNREVTRLDSDEAGLLVYLCDNKKGECQQDIIEQRRKRLDELIQRMNEKLQKLEITAKYNVDRKNIATVEVKLA